MIKWKQVGEITPTNKDKPWNGAPETPYVTCIIWVCCPPMIEGGIPFVVRWDTANKCWHRPDLSGKWIFDAPYEITHFCDDINNPSPTAEKP